MSSTKSSSTSGDARAPAEQTERKPDTTLTGTIPTISVKAHPVSMTVYQNQLLIRRQAPLALSEAHKAVQVVFPLPRSGVLLESVQVGFSSELSAVAVLRGVVVDEIDAVIDDQGCEGDDSAGPEPYGSRGKNTTGDAAASAASEVTAAAADTIAERSEARAALHTIQRKLRQNERAREAAAQRLAYVQSMSERMLDPENALLASAPAMWDVETWKTHFDHVEGALTAYDEATTPLNEEAATLQVEAERCRARIRSLGGDPDADGDEDEEEEADQDTDDDGGEGGAASKQSRTAQSLHGAGKKQRVAVITLSTSAPLAPDAGAAIMVSYLSTAGRWEAQYDAHLDSASRTVELHYHAFLTLTAQCEPLANVAVTFSTAAPRRLHAPPTLTPWRCTLLPKERPKRRHTGASKFFMLGGAAASAAESRWVAENDSAVFVEEAVAVSAGAGSSVVNFTLPSPQTFPYLSCVEGRAVPITVLRLPVKLTYTCVPSLQPVAYARGILVNASDYPLLPGKVNISADSRFVAQSMLPATATGARLTLEFGPDDSLEITRDLITFQDRVLSGSVDKAGGNGGGNMFSWGSGKHRHMSYVYRTRIVNHKPATEPTATTDSAPTQTTVREALESNNDASITIVERAPKPDCASLVVKLLEPSYASTFLVSEGEKDSAKTPTPPTQPRTSKTARRRTGGKTSTTDSIPNSPTHAWEEALTGIPTSSEDEDTDGEGDGLRDVDGNLLNKAGRRYQETGEVHLKRTCAAGGASVEVRFAFDVVAQVGATIFGLDDNEAAKK